ncbi:hypothetical protein [Ferruginibacter sp. HRS2-29]|uniref:hypothetical protein n=1 Tax=Ferruginibacter sp. HRS2-29 TaxID=2487334 RepID=UPI0020CD1644|nr:hypothetical protein [Ferruginibacter sp. HRS2-29]
MKIYFLLKKYGLFSALILTIFIFSCKKTDFSYNKVDRSATELFFRVPSNINPSIKRVADEMRRRNEITEYITDFARNNGYPVWDKAIIKLKMPKAGGRGGGGNMIIPDTIICVPFVQQDSLFVNGYLLSSLDRSLSINYTLAQDYKAYPIGIAGNGKPSAEDFTTLIARLNSMVFGYKNFQLLNKKLFESELDTAINAIKKISIGDSTFSNSNNLLTTYTSCELVTVSVCVSTNSARMIVYHNPCWSYSQENCWDTIFDDGTGGVGGGTGGTGGGTGGGGGTTNNPTTPINGGNPVPHHFPCSRPPCTAPTGGLPILPIPDEPPINKTPCEKMAPLINYQSTLQTLDGYMSNPDPSFHRELGLPIGPDGIGNYEFGGIITSSTSTPVPQVNLNYQSNLSTLLYWIHTHPDFNPKILPIFSPSDIMTIYHLLQYRNSANQPWTDFTKLTVGIINWKHEAYFLVIDNVNDFMQFASDYDFALQGEDNLELEKMYNAYNITHNTSTNDTEKNFLSFLNRVGGGLKVMKANNNFSQFSELKLENGVVVSVPCT